VAESSQPEYDKAKLRKELIKGIVHLARHKEFYGHIVQQFEKVWVCGKHRIETAAVGRFRGERFIKMWMNMDFFAGIFAENTREQAWTYMLNVQEHEIIHCFPKGTMVGGSFVPIEKMTEGMAIVGSDGERHEAERVESRRYTGGLVSIKPMGVMPFNVTDHHRILVADIGWKTINTDKPRRNVRLIRNVGWKESQDVKKGDWLAVPRMKGHREDVEIDVSQYMKGNKWSLPWGVRVGRIPLNEDVAWLLGYYCAEGSASCSTGQVIFSMHEKERVSNGSEVARIVEGWGLGGKPFYQRGEGHSLRIVFNSVVMARMLRDMAGYHANTKAVPPEVFWHRDDGIVKAFLRGYFDGDGATESEVFSSASVSSTLACQLQMMSARIGAWMNMHFDELSRQPPRVIVSGKPRKLKDQYRLHSGGDDIRVLLGYSPVRKKGRVTRHHVISEDFIFVPVKEVSRQEKWSGTVYNLRSPTKDYLVHNVVVHNCVFGHLFLTFEDKTRGGVAVDCVVNGIMNPQDDKKLMPGNYVHPAHYGFPLDKSAMWYYTHLRENPRFQQQCKSGAFGAGGALSHIMSGHSAWDDVKDDPVAQEFAKDIVRKAKDLCNKQYGNIPGAVQQQIEELLKRKKAIVPWGRVLRMFCASAQESILDYTVKRVSRRYGTRPGTRKGDVLKLAVAIDTSGCFVGETLVPMANGGIKRIDDVVEGDMVVSSAFGGCQVPRKCTNVFEKEATELVSVTADKGFSFTCTPNHRIFVLRPEVGPKRIRKYDKLRRGKMMNELRESSVVEIPAEELQPGDWLITTHGSAPWMTPLEGSLLPMTDAQSGMYVTESDISEADRLKRQKGVSYRKQHRDGMMRFHYASILEAKRRGVSKTLPVIPKQPTDDFCQIVGYAIGDGHLSDATFVVTDESRSRLDLYNDLMVGVFGLTGDIKEWDRRRLVVNSKPLVEWWKDSLPETVVRSPDRTIPQSLTRLPDSKIAALLRGLFDAEGSVGPHYVNFANSSRSLHEQIHLLLLRLGIESTICDSNVDDREISGHVIKGGGHWRLSIYGLENLERFEEIVGFGCQEKAMKLARVVESIGLYHNNGSFPYTEHQRLVQVRAVEKTKLSQPVLVYDLEIEGEHNYMANGVVVHNSISDEQLVLFWNEINWVRRNGAEVWIYECDTQISPRSPFKYRGKWDGTVHGRGGTDLEPPLKECEGKYDALIYFTDFYAPQIETQYRIPILWVLTTELEKDAYPYRWGKHIKIDDGKAVAA